MDNENRLTFISPDSTAGDNEYKLTGYAIIWNDEEFLGDDESGFFEQIDRHALDGVSLKDIPLKYNHDNSRLILARTRNKSLTLTNDEKGLKIDAVLNPNIQAHREIWEAVKSGLIDSMSFGFVVDEQDIKRDENGVIHRTIKKIKRLIDTSIVDEPAYNSAKVYIKRSKDLLDNESAELEQAAKDKEIGEFQRKQKELEAEKEKIKILMNII